MATATSTRNSKRTTTNARATKAGAKTTTGNAKSTARSASATARSAAGTARTKANRTATTTRREARRTEQGVVQHGRRVVGAAQAEVAAVASQPTRPLFFALGLADRYVAGVRAVPSLVASVPSKVVIAPQRTRERLVNVVATAGDLAERAQRGYTEVAVDGQKLVAAVRRQDSTQAAVKYAERAQRRGANAVQDTEKAVEAAADAASDAVQKLG